jgi:hypothetical protein
MMGAFIKSENLLDFDMLRYPVAALFVMAAAGCTVGFAFGFVLGMAKEAPNCNSGPLTPLKPTNAHQLFMSPGSLSPLVSHQLSRTASSNAPSSLCLLRP